MCLLLELLSSLSALPCDAPQIPIPRRGHFVGRTEGKSQTRRGEKRKKKKEGKGSRRRQEGRLAGAALASRVFARVLETEVHQGDWTGLDWTGFTSEHQEKSWDMTRTGRNRFGLCGLTVTRLKSSSVGDLGARSMRQLWPVMRKGKGKTRCMQVK